MEHINRLLKQRPIHYDENENNKKNQNKFILETVETLYLKTEEKENPCCYCTYGHSYNALIRTTLGYYAFISYWSGCLTYDEDIIIQRFDTLERFCDCILKEGLEIPKELKE